MTIEHTSAMPFSSPATVAASRRNFHAITAKKWYVAGLVGEIRVNSPKLSDQMFYLVLIPSALHCCQTR